MSIATRWVEDDSEEITALIETLHMTSQRLEELTAGQVDTVASRDGRTFLLRHAQEHLRHSEAAKQAAILNALPAHIALLNTQGLIVSVNEAWRRFPGARVIQRPGYDIGLNYIHICCGSRGESSFEAYQIAQGIRSVLGGKSKRFSVEYRSDSGAEESWFLLTVTPLADDRRNGAVVMHLNITEQKRHSIERHAMGAKYRALLEAAPDAMVVVNQCGEIVLLNVQAEKQFRYRRDELLGQKVTNIIPEGFAERLVADDLRSADDALAQQIGNGIELTALRKDGTEFPIEIMLSPLASADGILVTAAIRDISVRKNAEKHLAQMEGRYRGLLEAAPDAMVVVNQVGEIVLLNLQAEKRFGYRRNELLGQKVTNIVPQGFAERLIADGLRSAEDALAQQIGTGIELRGRRKDGSEFPVELMLSPLGSADGILVTAAIRDITTRKKAEAHLLEKMEELNRSNEELGHFATIASHDLQEPLRMVGSYTKLLSTKYKGKLDADADEFIGFAVDGVTRMQRLIRDLLTYSRVGTKGKDLHDTSSEEALRQALMSLRGAIEDSGALVTHDPLPNVLADNTQLTQLFQNLVGNAIKYQSPGIPRVHVGVAKLAPNKWEFSVKDNGLGIESQHFERIFGMFQRLHKRNEFDGTGIGLAICKKIVERHGGSISVESQPGEGSTFRFALAESEGGIVTISPQGQPSD